MLTHFRLMTFNIAGGRETATVGYDSLFRLVVDLRPDILAVQEAWQIDYLDGSSTNIVSDLSVALGGYCSAFGPTLSMNEQFHPGKDIFVDGLFNDWQDWKLGNGLISKWNFCRLGAPATPGHPVNIPIYRPAVYTGTRDTDPRWMVLSRIDFGALKPFILTSHLTTLVGERRGSTPAIYGKTEEAQNIRRNQAETIVKVIRKHILEKDEFTILLGDFNAMAAEPCIQDVLQDQAGFIRLKPEIELPTHPKAIEPIDHILVFPGNLSFDYRCWIADVPGGEDASDHKPVIAEISLDL